MKTTKAVLIMAIGVGLALSAGAQPGKHPGEKVDLKSLPSDVQQTIKEKAAGGNVVKVMREDDPDGKWNYEVFVTTVVLVNCQLVGGAHEGQPGFTLVFAKAVLLHQWVQSAGLFWSQSS